MQKTIRTIAAAALLLPLAGCMVKTRTGAKGDKDVDVSTPLGGLSVKTDASAVAGKVGLPLYPGAVAEEKKGDDKSSADVNMSFGAFHLRVLAMGFTSSDSPDKVRAYYRKALGQYGEVIECQNKKPLAGSPTRTGLGLTCTDDNHIHTGSDVHVGASVSGGEIELKAGSRSRQHIVSLETKDSGTKFGLVSLELPNDNDKAN